MSCPLPSSSTASRFALGFPSSLYLLYCPKMWRRATNEVSGTNESTSHPPPSCYIVLIVRAAPLLNRRRFGPVPVEESAPPQLAQASPSAFPIHRPSPTQQDAPRPDTSKVEPGKRPPHDPIPGCSIIVPPYSSQQSVNECSRIKHSY